MGLVENYCCKRTPANMVLRVLALIALVYGLWMHSWIWIACGIVVALTGHILQAVMSRPLVESKRKR